MNRAWSFILTTPILKKITGVGLRFILLLIEDTKKQLKYLSNTEHKYI